MVVVVLEENNLKALQKERLIAAIEQNFEDGEIIFQDSETIKQIFLQLGDDWFIVDGQWQKSESNDVEQHERIDDKCQVQFHEIGAILIESGMKIIAIDGQEPHRRITFSKNSISDEIYESDFCRMSNEEKINSIESSIEYIDSLVAVLEENKRKVKKIRLGSKIKLKNGRNQEFIHVISGFDDDGYSVLCSCDIYRIEHIEIVGKFSDITCPDCCKTIENIKQINQNRKEE